MTDQPGFWCCTLSQRGMPCSCLPDPSQPPIARRRDPETSHWAARALRGSIQLGERQHWIIDAVQRLDGPSELQLFRVSPWTDRTCFSPVFARLRAAGWIENRPLGHPDRLTPPDPNTGRPQLRWFPGPNIQGGPDGQPST